SVGAQLRKFRLAVAATGEYTAANGGSAGALAQINAEVNAVNAVYERELAIRFELIANNNLIIFTDQFADGYTNGDTAAMINENQTVLDATIGAGSYDVGHVFGTGGGGQAMLGVVCAAGKAAGASLFTGTTLNTRLTAHEIGHQFGADHSYNSGTGAFCGGQRAPNAASETGGGASIMAYIKCQDTGLDDSIVNIFAASNLRFHNGSFTQITNYIGTTSCATTIATGNTPPTVSAGPGYTIPRNTPFTLTATASDADQADQNNLTYDWEQLDAGGLSFAQNGTAASFSDAGDPPNTTRPIFRPFPATTSPSRTFPSLQYILNNANVPPATITIPGSESQGGGTFHTAENLPNGSRTLKFRVTVRDNRAGGGGTTDAETTLTVNGASGPFNVTAPNGGETLTGGSSLNVTWNAAGTASAPVSAANVKITLSADGGQTFPVTLAASTPNDGSETLTVPGGILSTTVRLKIEAVGNIFFDISNANFSISPGGSCTAVSSIAPGIGNTGQDVILTGVNFTGVTAVKFSGNVEATNLVVVNDTTLTLKVPAGATTGSLKLVKAGCGEESTPGSFTVCTNQPVGLLADDGSAELDINAPTADNYFVNRLTPSAYPATLQSVRILFRNAPPGAISILAGTNTDGNGDIDNTVYQTVSATAPVLNQFNEYFFPPITITSGDFVVGFRMPGPVSNIMATDNTSTNQQRSYVSPDGTGYFTFPFGNFLIRAGIFAGACGSVGGGNCPTVNDIAPTSGAVGAQVTINGTNLDGVTAVTFGGG
ncbi:MAG TPA: zinc-dependent metalloprotease family protein, partial [Blastocatellia bacterium]